MERAEVYRMLIGDGAGGQDLAKGPYGVDAEKLIEVPVEIIERRVTGTNIAEILKEKGYKGP